MRFLTAGLIAAVIMASPCLAKAPTQIGSWFVSNEKDAFSDEMKVIAITPDEDRSYVLGVRCLNKEPSIMILPGANVEDPFVKGSPYTVKLRVDKGDVDSLFGMALQDKGVEVELNQATFKKLEGSNTFAFRLTTDKSDLTTDLVFTPRLTKAALATVKSACSFE